MKLINPLLERINNLPIENRIVAIREILFESVLAVFCVLGFIAVIMGGIEVYLQGRWALVFFYIAAYLPALICFFLRKKIPYSLLTNIVLLDLFILSLLILAGVGLSGAGIPLLITFCVLTTTFQGIGRGLISILMSVGAILFIGSAMHTGMLPIDIVSMTNSTRMEAWLMAAVMLFLIGSIMVVCLGVLQDSLQRTIRTIQTNTHELQASNQQLETAMKHQKKMEARLLESNSILDAALESTADGILVVDKNGKWTKFNQPFTELWQLSSAVFESGEDQEALAYVAEKLENPDEFFSRDQTLYQNPEMDSFDIIALKDGRTFERFSKPQKLGADIVGRVWSFRDITEKINSHTKLKQSEEKYRTMIEYSNDMIWTLDTAGHFTFFDKQTEKITGLKHEDWIGKSFVPLILEEDLPMIEQIFQKGLEGESLQYELRFKNPDDNILTISVTMGPLVKNGKVTGLVSFGRDITEQQKLKSQLQLSQKMESIGTLAGGIAHDFNNILFPIIGHTEMLMEDVGRESTFHSRLNKIYKGAMRAKDLVNQILAFSRHDKNQFKLIKLQPIIKEVLQLLRSTLPAMIHINQDISSDCGVIMADPTQLHQILMNLATNASHAMQENGGELKVSLKEIKLGVYDLITSEMKPGDYACLSVADTGMGMTENLTQKIFEPFFTTKEKGKGTGMGLSVVHGIVTSMGGVIQVFSEPAKGTQFHVYFPLEKNSVKEQILQKNAPIKGGGEKILLVDDEEAILTMGKQMLERLGYQVTPCASGIQALEVFRPNPDKFDLVITDMAMPNLSGAKLAAAITQIRPIPILLCTGFSEDMTEKKAVSLGITGVLNKPIVMKDFSRKIREVLDRSQAILEKPSPAL